MKRAFRLLAAVTALWSAAAMAADPGISDKEIKLGSVLPLQGGFAAGATQFRDGVDAYFKWVNEEGGVNGRKIVWSAENDSYNPQQSVAAIKKLVDRDGVFAIVGTLGTANTLAVLPFLKQRNVPLLGPLGSHPLINEPRDRNIFPISPTGPRQGTSLLQYAHESLNAKRIAVFYQDDQMGKELLSGVKQYAASHGLEIVGEASYVPSDVDVSAQALALRQSNPDAVVMAVIPKQGTLFLIAAQKLGWKSKFLALQVMGDPLTLRLGGDAVNNLYTNLYAGVETMTTPEIKQATEILGKYAPGTPPGYWSFIGMSGAKIFVEAAKGRGKGSHAGVSDRLSRKDGHPFERVDSARFIRTRQACRARHIRLCPVAERQARRAQGMARKVTAAELCE